MAATRQAGTKPELAIRRRLHALGLRYRVDFRVEPDLRTRPDIAFVGARVAVFVDGCFWHACPEHGTQPKANAGWWRQKIEANVLRDQKATAALESRGWTVVRIWEHEEPELAAERIADIVRAAQADGNAENRDRRSTIGST